MRDRSLSDFWRENSEDRVAELASVLQGADGMIGVMGSGVRAIWSTNGNSETYWTRVNSGKPTELRVFLDYSPLSQLRPPFIGRAVDEVIGYAAHEGGHCLWTAGDSAKEALTDLISRLPMFKPVATGRRRRKVILTPTIQPSEAQVKEALRVANIIEDAYIDYHVAEKWPVLGEYIQWSRNKIHEKRPIDFTRIAAQDKPARNHVLNLWIACSLYSQDIPDNMSDSVTEAMGFLMKASVQAVKTESFYVRCEIAASCWEVLQAFPENPDPLPREKPKEKEEKTEEKEKPEQESEPQDDGQEGGQGQDQPESEPDNSEQDKEQDDGKDKAKPEESGKDQPEEVQGEDEGKSDEESGEEQSEEEGESPTGGEEVPGEGPTTEGEGQEDGDDEGKDAEAGSGTGENGEGEEGSGESSAESEDEEEQKLGHFGGDNEDGEESSDDKEEPSQGGDSDGAPGNLDEFDVRDIEGLPEEILEQVVDAIAHELEDLSKSVALALGDSSIKAQTRRADYDGPAAQKAKEQVEPEIMALRRLFERQRMEASRSLTGLTSGKLNGRKLARAGAGNFHVFKRREVIGKPDMAVGLLLDVSWSMNSNMGVVWMTASVFGEALAHVDGVNFLCLTYTGNFEVQTTLVCSREMGKVCFGNVDQGGGTPSGPAIGAMKVHLDRMSGKRKVIIHFTDGSPDDSDSVVNAVQVCHKDGYEVWSIGFKGMENTLAQQYGEGNYKTISTIKELPEKVGELLKKLVMDR